MLLLYTIVIMRLLPLCRKCIVGVLNDVRVCVQRWAGLSELRPEQQLERQTTTTGRYNAKSNRQIR